MRRLGDFIVYALVDPLQDRLFYVGSTGRLLKRIANHRDQWKISMPSWRVLGSSTRGRVVDECCRILDAGRKPVFVLIEQIVGFDVTAEHAREAEQFWIDYFKSIGAPLLNSRKAHSRREVVEPRGLQRFLVYMDI